MSQLSNDMLDREFAIKSSIDMGENEEDVSEWEREQQDRMMQERHMEEEKHMREPYEQETSYFDF